MILELNSRGFVEESTVRVRYLGDAEESTVRWAEVYVPTCAVRVYKCVFIYVLVCFPHF